MPANVHFADTTQHRLLDFLFRSFRNDIGLFSDLDLRGSTVDSSAPLKIADLNGADLFLDYRIVDREGNRIGVLRSSARGSELALIDAIMIGGSLFKPSGAQERAVAAAASKYPGSAVRFENFVCYGYPRIGVRVEVVTSQETFAVIYDAHTLDPVRKVKISEVEEAGLADDDDDDEDIEGEPFYSFLSTLPESGPVEVDEQRWRDAARYVVACQTGEAPHRHTFEAGEFDSQHTEELIINMAGPPDQETELNRPAMEGAILPVPLIGQETPVYCAVATGKMILEYLGYHNFSQTEIAEAFRTGPKGTTNKNMRRGLSALTDNQWRARLDVTPTVGEAHAYMSNLFPGKSGIPGHARLLRGWRDYVYLSARTGEVILRERFYIINDPYPTNEGRLVLENVSKPTDDFYRNLLTLRVVAPE